MQDRSVDRYLTRSFFPLSIHQTMKKLALAVTLTLFCLAAEGQAQISTLDLLLEKPDGTALVTLSAPATGSAYRMIFPAAPTPLSNASGSILFVNSVTGSELQASLLTPGTNGQVLRLVGGLPTWQTVNVLPAGSTINSTLVWDGTSWVENTNLTSNPTTGATNIGGDLTVTGPNVNLPAGSISNTELANSSVTINTGTGLSGGGNVALGGTLNLTNTGVTSIVAGTGVTVSGATGAVTINSSGISTINGTTNQINVATPSAGTVTLSTPQNIHTGASPTFVGATLTGLSGSSTATNIVVAGAGGALQTRSISSLPTTGGAEPYVTFGAGSSNLTNNRVVQAGTGIDIADAGTDNGSLTIKNTGLLNAAAGNGISVVTNNGTATIANTGVINLNVGTGLSATGSTGAITLTNTGVTSITAGTGISVSGSTGAVTINSTGGFTGVTTNATLGGNGTTGSPLGINLTNANTWTGTQTFATAIINGGSINSTPIGNTAPSTAVFTTLGATGNTVLGNGGDNTTINVTGGELKVNGLTQDNTQGSILVQDGNGRVYTRSASSLAGASGWLLTGNAGTTAGTNFLGTTDNQPLELKVNSDRVMRYAPGDASGANSPNLTGGYKTNSISSTGTDGNFIGGGGANNVPNVIADYADYSAIVGGALNSVGYSADYSIIGGGEANEMTIEVDHTVIGGGQLNTAYDRHGFIGGGYHNTTGTSGSDYNDARYASVVGGYENTASAYKSFVGGGLRNHASGQRSAIVGGQDNKATHQEAFVGAGEKNEAKADNATIGGGYENVVTGSYSAIPGGRGLTLSGAGSMGFLGGNTGSNDMSVSESNVTVLGNTDLWLANNDNSPSQIRFYQAQSGSGAFPASATKYSSFEARSQSKDVKYLLPDSAGHEGDVLIVTSLNTTSNTVTLDWAEPNATGGIGSFLFARKTSDETNTGKNLSDDDHLSLSLASNTTYQIEGTLYADRTQGNSDLDIAFDTPSGATMLISFNGFEDKSGNSNTGNGIRDQDAKGSTNASGYGPVKLGNNLVIVQFKGIVITGNTAGDVELMWTPDATGDKIKLRKNSIMSAQVIE